MDFVCFEVLCPDLFARSHLPFLVGYSHHNLTDILFLFFFETVGVVDEINTHVQHDQAFYSQLVQDT